MNTKDLTTNIGGLLLALGPIIQQQIPAAWAYWVGSILTALGGVLLGARGTIKTPPTPPTNG